MTQFRQVLTQHIGQSASDGAGVRLTRVIGGAGIERLLEQGDQAVAHAQVGGEHCQQLAGPGVEIEGGGEDLADLVDGDQLPVRHPLPGCVP